MIDASLVCYFLAKEGTGTCKNQMLLGDELGFWDNLFTELYFAVLYG